MSRRNQALGENVRRLNRTSCCKRFRRPVGILPREVGMEARDAVEVRDGRARRSVGEAIRVRGRRCDRGGEAVQIHRGVAGFGIVEGHVEVGALSV